MSIHDSLHESHKHKIDLMDCGFVLLSHLFGNAHELCGSIQRKMLDSDDCSALIFDEVHKKDSFSVVTDVFTQLKSPIFTTFRRNESYRLFKARFNAQLHRYNEFRTHTTMSEAVCALLLLNNIKGEYARQI